MERTGMRSGVFIGGAVEMRKNKYGEKCEYERME